MNSGSYYNSIVTSPEYKTAQEAPLSILNDHPELYAKFIKKILQHFLIFDKKTQTYTEASLLNFLCTIGQIAPAKEFRDYQLYLKIVEQANIPLSQRQGPPAIPRQWLKNELETYWHDLTEEQLSTICQIIVIHKQFLDPTLNVKYYYFYNDILAQLKLKIAMLQAVEECNQGKIASIAVEMKKYGMDINSIKNSQGESLLMIAASVNFRFPDAQVAIVVKQLIVLGANPWQTSRDKRTPLMSAANCGRLSVVNCLLDNIPAHQRDKYIDQKDDGNATAMTYAAGTNTTRATKYYNIVDALMKRHSSNVLNVKPEAKELGFKKK